VVQTPDYSKKVMDIIDRIHRAPDVPGVLEMLRTSTLTMGARASMYAVAIPEDGSNLTLKVLLACDPLWGYAQHRACPLEIHPWFAYASEHFRPIAASRIAAEAVQQREAVAIAHQHGFSSAFIVPTPTGGGLGGFGVLWLGSGLQGEFDHEDTHVVRVLARTLAMELHEWFANETRDWLLHSAGLQPGDLQLLALERRGLSTKAIAQATGLSAVSVHSRFQRINARLACSRRKDAARRAAEYGLI
jgi:DNA-binding CsgD family transcriptional regulator